MSHRIAIIGSGPSGFYTLDGLLRSLPGAQVDLFDRMPMPYGLVRFGVAPDHQGTKAVARQFERLALKPGVRFFGNVEIGRDLSLDELRAHYDVVVLATGAVEDRKLGIPGEDLHGVYGSWQFVAWYNGHPDWRDLAPLLDRKAVAVIGNGNVAIDVVRILAKTQDEMARSDICEHAEMAIAASPLTDLHMIGRRGPIEANFTTQELAELGRLHRAQPLIEGAEIPASSGLRPPLGMAKDNNLEAMRQFAKLQDAAAPVKMHLRFWTRPVAIVGGARVEGLVVEDRHGARSTIAVGAVISAIGYRATPLGGVAFDEARGVVASNEGVIDEGLCVVGWAKRGPSGVIATNRADSLAVVDKIAAALAARPPKTTNDIAGLLAERAVRVVDFPAWQKIEHAETEAGKACGRPRVKIVDLRAAIAAGLQ